MTTTEAPSWTSSSSYSSSPLLTSPTPLLLATAKRAVHPYLCVICRVLLICAFIDNASQTLLDYTHHVLYLTSTYHVPSVVALLLIAASSMTSFLACTMVFLKPLRRRGIHLLLLCLVYQHVVYGFMSPPSSASSTSFSFNNNNNHINVQEYAQQHGHSYQYSSSSVVVPASTASLIRTVCLVLTLLLLRTQTKPGDDDRWNRKNATLLTTVVNREQRDRKTYQQRKQQQQQRQSRLFRAMWNVDAIALVSRAMFAVLACQMASLSGVTSMWIVAPMAAAYLFGFMTDIISVLLIAFYILATFSTHKFWLVDPSANPYAAFERHALRFEFTHNVSIVSGLVVLFTMGPGALSFDKCFTRQQTRVNNNTPSQLSSRNVNNNPPSAQLVHILT